MNNQALEAAWPATRLRMAVKPIKSQIALCAAAFTDVAAAWPVVDESTIWWASKMFLDITTPWTSTREAFAAAAALAPVDALIIAGVRAWAMAPTDSEQWVRLVERACSGEDTAPLVAEVLEGWEP